MFMPLNIANSLTSLTLTFKSRLRANKRTWSLMTIGEVPAHVSRLNPEDLKSGIQAVYLSPVITQDGQRYVIPWLDIEHPTKHTKSIQANIDIAQELFFKLDEHGLICDPLPEIILTGNGFRFCWPFAIDPEYVPAFMAMIKDKENWPGIDPSPQVNGNPLRLFAYRGHENQGAKGNVHDHLLDDPGTLIDFNMTEACYKELVFGPAPAERIQTEWISRVLPRQWLPKPWKCVLDKYRAVLKLRSNIIPIRFPRSDQNSPGVNLKQIFHRLEELDITWREQPFQETELLKLSSCPECGKSEGSPWIGPTGRLKCFRASCPAGQHEYDQQHIEFRRGLLPQEWVPGYEGHIPDSDEVKPELVEKTGIEVARHRIADALEGSKEDLLIRSAAGIGKTTITLEHLIKQAQDGPCLMTVPTDELAEEVRLKAQDMAYELNVDIEVRRIQGRKLGKGEKQLDGYPAGTTCYRTQDVHKVSQKGFYPALLVCPDCSRKRDCPYQSQFKGIRQKTPILIICSHAQLPHLPDKILQKLQTVVLDENPLQAMMKKDEISPDAFKMIKAKIPEERALLISKMENAADLVLRDIRKNDQARFYATEPPSGDWKNSTSLWDAAGISAADKEILALELSYFEQYEGENPYQWQRRLLGLGVNMTALNWLWTALGEGQGTAYMVAKIDRQEPVQFCLYRSMFPKLDNARLIFLDATGERAESEGLSGRPLTEVDGLISLDHCRKIFYKRSIGKMKATAFSDQQIRSRLKQACRYLKPRDKKVFLLTHQVIEGRALQIAPELEPGREWVSGHFWASRGVNAYQDCNAVICFGTPTINPAQVLDNAMALFSEHEERDRWVSQMGPRDLVQGVNRIRPIYGENTLIVMGREWPSDYLGKPTFTIDGQHTCKPKEAAFERLKMLIQDCGFITLDFAYFLGVGRKKDSDVLEETKRRWMNFMQGGETGLEFLLFLIKNIYIRNSKNDSQVLEPVLLTGDHDWTDLMNRLADECEMPLLEVKMQGAGRPIKGAGYLDRAKDILSQMDCPFDLDHWSGRCSPIDFEEAKNLAFSAEADNIFDLLRSSPEPEIITKMKKHGYVYYNDSGNPGAFDLDALRLLG